MNGAGALKGGCFASANPKQNPALARGVFDDGVFARNGAPDIGIVNGNVADGGAVVGQKRGDVDRAVGVEDIVFAVGKNGHDFVVVEHAHIAGNIVAERCGNFLIFKAELNLQEYILFNVGEFIVYGVVAVKICNKPSVGGLTLCRKNKAFFERRNVENLARKNIFHDI